jgi:hypothetical protein
MKIKTAKNELELHQSLCEVICNIDYYRQLSGINSKSYENKIEVKILRQQQKLKKIRDIYNETYQRIE